MSIIEQLAHSYTNLPAVFFRHQQPTPAPAPQMVIFNQRLAEALDMDAEALKNAADIFAGNRLPPSAKPISQAYAGHQFGHLAMLGDGRAVLLGEHLTPDNQRLDIQLKGAGPTPFSRGGDGYAALLPMLREYIISEALFSLGIPTTRSLAVVSTGRDIRREMRLPGAVLTRVAASHIRVGTFTYAAAFCTADDTRALADYSIWRHYPELEAAENKYLLFLRKVAERQASLIAQWQLVGFIHGVMNTDNMAISGETIDYGPCAFMDAYHPNTVFSSIDTHGRYAYKNQPLIGAWNLARLAEALLPDSAQAAQEIEHYHAHYTENWLNGMRAKLGLTQPAPEDDTLINTLLDIMAQHKLDYTNTFRQLSFPLEKTSPLLNTPGLADWHKKWQTRAQCQNENPHDIMQRHNPAIIPRNHRVEEALAAAAQGDISVLHRLLAALSNPFEDDAHYAQPPPPTGCGYRTFCGT